MQPFVVTFAFATMPIVNGACTLDAVLGGEIARGVASLDEAISATPLARTDGVSHGSSLVVLGDTGVIGPMPVVQRGGAVLARLAPGRIPKGRRRTDRFGAGSVLSRYPMRVCEGGAWLGTGRVEAVQGDPCRGARDRQAPRGRRRHDRSGLARRRARRCRSRHLGARHRTVRWRVRHGCARARAPLPLALFRRLGGEPTDAAIAIERVRQPYHDTRNPAELAVVPWP